MSRRNKYRGFPKQEREAQKIRALEMWMAGEEYRTIAKEFDVSSATAYKRVQAALDDMRPHADYDKFRAVQLAELEMSRRPMRKVIVSFDRDDNTKWSLDDCVKAINALCRLQEREAKLLNLDKAPNPIDEMAGMTDQQLAAMVHTWADEMAEA